MPLQDQARAALRVVVDLNASVVVLPYDADVVRQQYCGGPGVDPVALDRVFDAAYHQADPFCCGVFHWSGFGVGHSIRRVSALVRRRSPPSCLPGPRPHWSVGAVGRFRDRAGCRDHDPQLASRYSSASEEIAGSLVRSRTLARGIESMTFDIVALIPPQADAEFVAHMEQVLDLYQKPYDPNCPVVCMDEQPVQLVQETRPPMAATKNRPRRVDYEYERAGTAAVFLFSEPLAGWRQATARARRTKVDWALEVAGLLEGRYADCPKITLVCDHLNTHTKGAFYEVFEPARARELVRRIEFCHTPKHGSWLNIAENELSSMTRQCVRGRRIGDLGTLHDEVSAWSTDVNGTQRGVDWQMKVDDARWKLKSVYPHIIT